MPNFQFSRLDTKVLIPLIEDIVQQEKRVLETNKTLRNPERYLEDDYRISQLQKLLCFLSREAA